MNPSSTATITGPFVVALNLFLFLFFLLSDETDIHARSWINFKFACFRVLFPNRTRVFRIHRASVRWRAHCFASRKVTRFPSGGWKFSKFKSNRARRNYTRLTVIICYRLCRSIKPTDKNLTRTRGVYERAWVQTLLYSSTLGLYPIPPACSFRPVAVPLRRRFTGCSNTWIGQWWGGSGAGVKTVLRGETRSTRHRRLSKRVAWFICKTLAPEPAADWGRIGPGRFKKLPARVFFNWLIGNSTKSRYNKFNLFLYVEVFVDNWFWTG